MDDIESAAAHGGADALATVTKQATETVGRRVLAAEATVLRRVAHPGVVRLVAHAESEGNARLVTERVGGPTLAELTVDGAAALAAVGAAAAAVIADLHALGIAHGSITPEHVICSGRRVVLCSFGRAGEATDAAIDRDVADLVVAITRAAERLGEAPSRLERRRRRSLDALLVGSASRSMSAAELGAALAELATTPPAHAPNPGDSPDSDATADPGIERIPAGPVAPPRPRLAPLAHPWRERVPHRRPDRSAGPEGEAWYRRRRSILAGAGAGVLAVALWIILAPGGSDPAVPVAALSFPATSSPSPSPSPSPAVTSAVAPTAVPAVAPEISGVAVVGNLVAFDGGWFEVGRTDDIVRVGDWDCNGHPSPAVLRPATGEVFVFDDWVDDGVRRIGPLTVVPDAIDLQAARSGRCDALVAVDDRGQESTVEVSP